MNVNRYAVRLAVAVAALVLVDRRVASVLARAEQTRYESGKSFRFENSDLFALGPAVEYFREHPKGASPRVVFFGDSVVWGYWIGAAETVPAQFQRLVPDEFVFNFGINGFETGSGFLISKAMIDAVDTIYLFDVGESVEPLLPRLVPVSDVDMSRLRLNRPDPLEARLRRWAEIWKLYRYAYRLQAAWFGMSTRLYVYQNKGEILRSAIRALRRQPAPPPRTTVADGPVPPGVRVSMPVAPNPPTPGRAAVLAAAHPRQWDFARLVRDHDKRAIVVEMEGHSQIDDEGEIAEFNAAFNPAVSFARLVVPLELRPDHTHFSPEGARAVAQALRTLHPTAARSR